MFESIKNITTVITVAILFILLLFLPSFSAVYLFNSGGSSTGSSEPIIADVTLKNTCTIKFSAGSVNTVSFIDLLKQYCAVDIQTSQQAQVDGWIGTFNAKEPDAFRFTHNVQVILEVTGGGTYDPRESWRSGKGGYTKMTFVILKNALWKLNVYYNIGKRGCTNPWSGVAFCEGGGGSMIAIGYPEDVPEGAHVFSKNRVIAVIAGGAGHSAGHGGGNNNCGRGSWYVAGGGCHGTGGWARPGPRNSFKAYGGSIPSNKVGLASGGGGIGGGGYGGGGGAYAIWSDGDKEAFGGGGGGYCGFLGNTNYPTCYGTTGGNAKAANGWGKITLIPQ